jgi:hypothetical protein
MNQFNAARSVEARDEALTRVTRESFSKQLTSDDQ